MKILIKGHYGFGNLGDDILLVVTYNLIKNKIPDAEIYIFSNFTQNLIEYNQMPGYNNYIYKLLSKDIKIIDWTHRDSFDMVINGGGGIYFDNSKGAFFIGFINYLFKHLFGASGTNKIEKFARLILNKTSRIIYSKHLGIGLSIGEYTKGSKSFIRHLSEIGSYNFIWVRDEFSMQKLRKYRFNQKYGKYTDIAFLSQFWMTNNNFPREKVTRIGIVLMELSEENHNINYEIKKFIKKAIIDGFKISLFSFDENHDKPLYSEFEDHKIEIWQPNSTDLGEYLNRIGDCQIVFSMRAHGAILGAVLGSVPVCIESSIKLKEVANMFPNSGSLLGLNSKSADLFEQTNKIKNQYQSFLNNLSSDLMQNSKIAKEGVADLMLNIYE